MHQFGIKNQLVMQQNNGLNFYKMNKKLLKLSSLKELRIKYKNSKIVLCHGVFDLFHLGHLKHLESAKKFGDILIVSITPDLYVNKGPGRPKFNETERSQILASLELVDFVIINNQPNSLNIIENLSPNFYVKGPDYKNKKDDITKGILLEEKITKKNGGKLIFTKDDTESSSSLLNNYFNEWNDTQHNVIKEIKDKIGVDNVLNIIESFKNLKVLVVGEPIIDTYIFCKPENLSSKSPSISANFLYQENYAGGVLAVAKHLDALGCKVTLMSPHGNENYTKELMKEFQVHKSIKNIHIEHPNIVTPRKTRYITPFMNQRMFEITNLNHESYINTIIPNFENKLIECANKADLVILLDFGHGLWENRRLLVLDKIKTYIALNVQTNSGNYGYNLFHKHKKYNYLVIDERELRLGMHDRNTDISDLSAFAFKNKIKRPYTVTLGSLGSRYFDKNGKSYTTPTYFTEPVDTTGAGDAFFCITALLQKVNTPSILIPFIGNLYAGLKTKILGNKSAVNKIDLIRSLNTLLK